MSNTLADIGVERDSRTPSAVPPHMSAGASDRRARRARQQTRGIDRKLSPAYGRDDPPGAPLCRRLSATENTPPTALASSPTSTPSRAKALLNAAPAEIVRYGEI